jgi:hypothetical protein
VDIETARRVLDAMANTQLTSLRNDLYKAAVRYAGIRTTWFLADSSGRAEIDASRRMAHDAFIDSCNILSRQMREHGEKNDWRGLVGEVRGEIGDFACFVHCLLGLSAR